MRIRYALRDAAIRPDVLNAALETSTRANEALLRAGEARPISEAIRRGLVQWRPEPFTDGEHFDDARTVLTRGWGDCDDLAPSLASELRVTGRDPGARAIVKRSGPRRWHAVVRTSDGAILDPSRWAGMGRRQAISGSGVQSSIVEPEAGCVGIKRYGNRWAVRCDLPIDGTGMHVCGQALRRSFDDAIIGAIEAASMVGESSDLVHPELLDRAAAWQAVLTGDDGLAEEVSDDDEVGFLPLAAALAPTALSMVSKLMPGGKKGGGAPAPSAAAPGGAIPSAPVSAVPAGGGGPTTVTPYGPGGPIIVRF